MRENGAERCWKDTINGKMRRNKGKKKPRKVPEKTYEKSLK